MKGRRTEDATNRRRPGGMRASVLLRADISSLKLAKSCRAAGLDVGREAVAEGPVLAFVRRHHHENVLRPETGSRARLSAIMRTALLLRGGASVLATMLMKTTSSVRWMPR